MTAPSIRFPDWDARLRRAIDDMAQVGFRWGAHDCCLAAADLVCAMTGWDPAEPIRGRYACEWSAARLIHSRGGIVALVSDLLDTNPVPTATAQRGDVVLLRPMMPGHLEQLGVCIGDAAVVAAEMGLLHRSMGRAIHAWRID